VFKSAPNGKNVMSVTGKPYSRFKQLIIISPSMSGFSSIANWFFSVAASYKRI
jgi:hypothetical protein